MSFESIGPDDEPPPSKKKRLIALAVLAIPVVVGLGFMAIESCSEHPCKVSSYECDAHVTP